MSRPFDDVNSGISTGIAVTDSIGYRAPMWYHQQQPFYGHYTGQLVLAGILS